MPHFTRAQHFVVLHGSYQVQTLSASLHASLCAALSFSAQAFALALRAQHIFRADCSLAAATL
eukprot:444795-Alexandrium_andersonii.AAC.1